MLSPSLRLCVSAVIHLPLLRHSAGKLKAHYPFYTKESQARGKREVPVFSRKAVLSIFWTLAILGPISDERGRGFPAFDPPAPDPSARTKELADMKRANFSLLTVLVLVSLAGCVRLQCGGGCGDGYCAGGGCADGGCYSAECRHGGPCCNDPNGGNDPNTCNDACPCGQKRCCLCFRLFGHHAAAKPQPAVATAPIGQVAYPYYTVRGPRDFLCKNPQTIGP